jgi:hypothetical protein
MDLCTSLSSIDKLNNYLKSLEISDRDKIDQDKGVNKTLERDLLIEQTTFNPIRLNFDTNKNENQNSIDEKMSNYNFVKKNDAFK